MPGFEILLPTRKLYQASTCKDFNEKKQQWIADNLGGHYNTMPERDKWAQLIAHFITRLATNSHHKATFNAFKDERLNIDYPNYPNFLSLTDCINYFEHFIFIYSIAKPDEQLRMLPNIMAGMDPLCEPGRRTQFENTLCQYRTDIYWIPVELYHHRKNIVRFLADQYNQFNAIGDGMSIHTVMQMEKSAASSLGFEPLSALTDNYLTRDKTQSIDAFFHRHSETEFVRYESDVAKNLTNHLMIKVSTWANEQGIVLDDWERNRPPVTFSQLADFERFICGFLDKAQIHRFVELGSDDDYNSYTLHSKTSFEEALKNIVNEKLIDDGYFVKIMSCNPLAQNLSEANIQLRQGVTQDQWVEFLKALDLIAKAPHSSIDRSIACLLIQYPTVLNHLLRQSPDFWLQLTKSDKNNISLIDACIAELTQLLLNAQSDMEIDQLITTLFTITQSNSDYLNTLSPQLMKNKPIVKALVKKRGLLLSHASEGLRRDDEIINEAMQQNPKAALYISGMEDALDEEYTRLRNTLPNDLKPVVSSFLPSVKIKGLMIQRMENINAF